MMDDRELKALGRLNIPDPDAARRAAALDAAVAAFEAQEIDRPQGFRAGLRLTERIGTVWSRIMELRLATAAPAIAALLALPLAGYATWHLMHENTVAIGDGGTRVSETAAGAPARPQEVIGRGRVESFGLDGVSVADRARPAPQGMTGKTPERAAFPPGLSGMDESGDRFGSFDPNPVKTALENPVSTFSIDVDTASYSFVRGLLNRGGLPDPDVVRIEEMINYFPYDWPGPEDAGVPFKPTVTVMPSPWNVHTRLMHVAIKGFEIAEAEKPRANLVFLVDTSGSMNQPNKLPLLKAAFRMLVDRLDPEDSIAIVTYAGTAGVALEPTAVSRKAEILEAIDGLGAGGRTAGAAGIAEAYRLAEKAFVEGGVNRVMLATDGDFNVGATDDAALKRMIEKRREGGIYLSVFGFGHGNYNDQLMQTLAQHGNGQAFYIDTIAEARKSLVEEAGSTLFPIARDVKIQVEFNPARVAEYRLIGYETRALNREDFNNDRVDAGDVGSGHSVTAIYEITPVGSPAVLNDELRYRGEAGGDLATSQEYALVKLRYKLPGKDTSDLLSLPVSEANEIADLEDASDDQRFSVAVAAFGQKLRNSMWTADLGYDRIVELANASRGSDPFGYRSEFVSLARIASALDD